MPVTGGVGVSKRWARGWASAGRRAPGAGPAGRKARGWNINRTVGSKNYRRDQNRLGGSGREGGVNSKTPPRISGTCRAGGRAIQANQLSKMENGHLLQRRRAHPVRICCHNRMTALPLTSHDHSSNSNQPRSWFALLATRLSRNLATGAGAERDVSVNRRLF